MQVFTSMRKILITICFINGLVYAQSFPGKMGVGLDGIGGVALEFPNVTLTSTGWQSVALSGQPAQTDALGWPIEDFRVVFFDHRPYNAWNNNPDDPSKYVVDQSGTYTLTFKGQATLTSWSDAPIQFQNQQYDGPSNTTTVDIYFPPGGGGPVGQLGNYGFLMVNFLNTNYSAGINGVKNIRLMRPGYQHNSPQIFRTAYVNAISPFSTIRFMDYLRTNNSDSIWPNKQTWAERQQPNAPRYSKCAPWETIIALANYTGKDVWINIPVDADSMYVVQLANLMKNTMRSDQNIYIEYSNEVWNGSFTQYQYNYDAVLLAPEDADIRNSTTFDDRRRARRTAKYLIKWSQVFENVFGVSLASRTRIRPVFAWQIGGWLPWYDDVLNWINSTYGPPKNFIYSIASAPYFNDNGSASNATPQQVVATMSSNSDANVANIQTLAQMAEQWQIKHMQYEGGPDNGGGSTTNIANRIMANRIPEMKTAVVHNYADNWFSQNANGSAALGTNDLANYFVMSGGVSRYGCWGATEDINFVKNLPNAPKYDALCELTGACLAEPSVTVTSPLNNAQVPVNVAFNIDATASDPDGTVKKVEFFVDAQLVGVDSIAPYSVAYTPVQTGIMGVLAKVIDNDGKYTISDATVVEVVGVVGINELNASQIKVYPVPANDLLNIEMQNHNAEIIGEISDIAGRVLSSAEITSATQVSVSHLTNGVYFISFKTEGRILSVRKFSIAR